MRFACLTLIFSLGIHNCWSQSLEVLTPWNPDQNHDGVIGVADLVPFLSEFGLQWTPEPLQLDSLYPTESGYVILMSDGQMLDYINGCTDPAYIEYNPAATIDDNSCITAAYACGDSVLFDGYWYETVVIGDQCWFAENLRTTVYANGDQIPDNLTSGQWVNVGVDVDTEYGATCIYGEGSSTCNNYSPDIDACNVVALNEYGRLYNGYAVANDYGLCPAGWHVPTNEEWSDLENYIDSAGYSDTDLKANYGWFVGFGGGNGSDTLGFSAFPGGRRNNSNGVFEESGREALWWSSTFDIGENADGQLLLNGTIRRLRYTSSMDETTREGHYGLSVRCLKDPDVLGCTDIEADNFDASANTEDGSCIYYGCTDSTYVEFDPAANEDDGSCLTLVLLGCTDSTYVEFNPAANEDDGSCLTLVVLGCTDSTYVEYDAVANADDGSCLTLPGCSDSDMVSMDGYDYNVVTIGDQCWFAENLRTTVYANGDLIPAGLTDLEWSNTTAGATAVYGEGEIDCFSPNIWACDEVQSLAEYGRLYNWYAVDDARGLCPAGWHVPTDGEWTELAVYISSQGFAGTEGTALKSTSGWSGDGNGTDDFGFSGLPGGCRIDLSVYFYDAGHSGYWWSSSPNGGYAWARDLYIFSPGVQRYSFNPRYGFSVRCLRDAE